MISEARRKANKKYDKLNMDTIGIKYKREIIQRIKQYAKDKNISINKLCINSVLYCIENNIDLTDDKTE